MARPLRIEYPGAAYHIMNRGNAGNLVFEANRDYFLFLDKLAEGIAAYNISLRCYCLMPNHFHLYIMTHEANLSRFMQGLLTAFTVSKNRRDDRHGHLFQGRYKSLLVEDELYGSRVGQYIHLNSVRTKHCCEMNINEKRKLLKEYRWSSYPFLTGRKKCPAWLDYEAVLCRWGKQIGSQRRNYAKFVENGLLRDIDDPFEAAAARSILGSERFIESMRTGLSSIAEDAKQRRARTQGAKILAWVNVDDLISIVSHEFNVSREVLLKPHTRNNEARKILLYLTSIHCRGRYTLGEIGRKVGVSDVGLTSARFKVKQDLKGDRKLANRIAAIEKQLCNKP